jgi:peroxiredoxin
MSVDVTSEAAAARKFKAQKNITFTTLNGSWELASRLFGVQATPTNILLDRQGRIMFRHLGFRGDESVREFEAEIEALLSRGETASSK